MICFDLFLTEHEKDCRKFAFFKKKLRGLKVKDVLWETKRCHMTGNRKARANQQVCIGSVLTRVVVIRRLHSRNI